MRPTPARQSCPAFSQAPEQCDGAPSQARAFEDIPHVTLPDDYPTKLGPFLVGKYEQYGPVFRTTYLGVDVVYLVGPEANRFVLSSNRDKFSHHEGWGRLFGVMDVYGNGLLTMDGPEHDRHRRLMNPAFASGSLDRYQPLMNRVIAERIAAWGGMEEVDVYQEARRITFDIAAGALAGFEIGPELDRFRALFLNLLAQGMRARVSRSKDELADLLVTRIRERRAYPTDDLLGMLVQARDEAGVPLSDAQLMAHINILLVAGHETSASMIAWLLYLLTCHSDYRQRVLIEQQNFLGRDADPPLDAIKRMTVLDNALSEAERLSPPIATGPRGVVADFEFQGYRIPAGCYVFYAIAATHLMPGIFADPLRFDPDRFTPPREEHRRTPYSLVGFGGGPRICLGINFAKVEIKLLATHILRRYDPMLIPGQQPISFYRATGIPLRGIKMRFAYRRL